VLTTLGMAAAAAFGRPRGGSGKAPGFPLAASIRKMIAFPSFSVMIAALILQPWRFPDALESFLEKLGGTMAPLALFSVGFGLDLRLKALRRFAGPLAGGLFYKLLFAPALMTAVAYGVFGIRNEIAQVTIAQAAMAPMITGGIVAIDAGLEPELANLMVGVGIPLSLITVPIWAWLLRQP
jgi:predicted permease